MADKGFWMTQNVFFPLIKHLDIDGYRLYPGVTDQPGLHQAFRPGVSVVVGVNGLGKTTLLRIMLRLLTGPRDLRAGEELGGAQRELSKSIDIAEFARRVPDQAIDSTATLTFELGGRTITVKRALKDLKLFEVLIEPDQPALPSDNDLEVQYQLAVVELSGLVSFFDFVFLLRHVVFFLEDRRGLVWDRWAQTELLQMLFLSSQFQRDFRQAMGEALSADSAARNTHAVLTRERKRLGKLINAAIQNPATELNLLRSAVEQMAAQLEALEPELDQLDLQRREQRRIAEARRYDAAMLAQKERDLRETLLATIFPTLTDYGAMALSYMERGLGCVVCGATDPTHLATASKHWLGHESCPVCDAPPVLQEQRSEAHQSNEGYSSELADIESERRTMQEAALAADAEATSLHGQYLQAVTKRDALVTEHHEKAEELRVRSDLAKGTSPNLVATHDERIRVLEETVKDDRAAKSNAVSRLSVLVETLRNNLQSFQVEMCECFNKTIRAFLAEECTLSYRVLSRKIGQDSDNLSIEFPEFIIRMTSGVFRIDSEIRLLPSSVSESQREFIELAFRMSLLSVATRHSPCTLILDTPEASLDAVFIPRAGHAFHSFANDGSQPRVVLAASNLNGTEMIQSMLAISPTKPMDEEDRLRVLNLLEIAAHGRAFETYSKEYEDALERALAPRKVAE
jgi:hypothetical protein